MDFDSISGEEDLVRRELEGKNIDSRERTGNGIFHPTGKREGTLKEEVTFPLLKTRAKEWVQEKVIVVGEKGGFLRGKEKTAAFSRCFAKKKRKAMKGKAPSSGFSLPSWKSKGHAAGGAQTRKAKKRRGGLEKGRKTGGVCIAQPEGGVVQERRLRLEEENKEDGWPSLAGRERVWEKRESPC